MVRCRQVTSPHFIYPVMFSNVQCGDTEGEDKFIGLQELMHFFELAHLMQLEHKSQASATNKQIRSNCMRTRKEETFASCRG